METNEALKTALRHEAEAKLLKMIEQVEAVEPGDLKGLEQHILASVFALGRRWMEQMVSSQTGQERPVARREGACGHHQRLVGQRPKELLTVLGKVRFLRPYYQCMLPEGAEKQPASCTHGEAPADQLWGVGERRTSPGVQELVSYLGASLTWEEVAQTFTRLLPLAMSARQALALMQPVGETLARQEDTQVTTLFQQAAQARSNPQQEKKCEAERLTRLYIEMDGVLARMRRGSVAMEEKEQQRSGDVYREVKVGAVFAATGGPKRSQSVPGVFVDEAGPIRYVARRTSAENFGPLLYALAVTCGVQRARQVVVLGDGALWIWHLVAEHFPSAVQIVDLWHAREHIWKVAHAVFGRATPEGVVWATQACRLLEEGRSADVVTMIQALPSIAPEPGSSRSVPEIEADYFISNAERMRYPTYRAQGMHVGSGIAEAACKTVVSTRAKRAGMRWTPAGLDALLPLRTAVLNQTFDTFWSRHSRLIA